jgi:hypothetical protein
MKKLVLPLLAALALAGCGGGGKEDFARTLNRPANVVFASLGVATLPAEVTALFPALKLARTKPADNEVLYTLSGTDGEDATIRLVFEAAQGGKSTLVRAMVDVPAVRTVIDGKPKVISERKIEAELVRIVEAAGKGDAGNALSDLLGALAVATDKEALVEALKMIKDPSRARAALAAMGGDLGDFYDAESDADTVDRPQGADAGPQSDPNAAIEQAETARAEEEWREENKARAAGEAPDDASGDMPEPADEEE